jgi:beta-glucosidase
LNEGRGRIIYDIVKGAKAIVHTMLPGNYGGDALADLLSGDENFSGKLPYTYSAHTNALVKYDYKACERREVMSGVYDYDAKTYQLWWFGEGLSYTEFAYSNLTVDKVEFSQDDVLHFSVDVTNTGGCAGKDVVMLFSSDLYASVMPDNRRLRAFEKIDLQPGQTRTVHFSLPASDLAFVNLDNHWMLEEGDFEMTVGDQTLLVRCARTYIWNTPNIPEQK